MTKTNKTIEKQLGHRTIREFKQEPVPADIFDTLIHVAQRTATSNGMQTYSIIRITDQKKKDEISKVCRQEYVARAPELLVFIVDQYRNARIAEEKGVDSINARDMDKFFQGFTDSALAAQNLVVAAESMGLGVNYLGSILNDPERICEILELPELTFPVVGLSFGYPNQEPQLKPRMDMKFRLFENSYETFKSYLDKLKDYDKEMQTYYDLRNANKRVDSFTDQVAAKTVSVVDKRQEVMDVIRKQGFQLMLHDKE
ncbi:MAG: NADPH-dependent oxidoreductase [Bacillota bacterium]